MFAPTFIDHRGERILRIDYSSLTPVEIVAAADRVGRIIRAEPLRSVRALSILYARLSAQAAAALKQCAIGNAPHIRASALLGSVFWRTMATDVQVRGREELTLFDDERTALDWLASK